MSTKVKITILAILLMVSFASGRYLTPVKVVTEVKTVEVEKKKTDTNEQQNTHKETEVKEVVKPDGTKETTTKIVEDDSDKKSTSEKDMVSKETDKTKEVTKSNNGLSLSALGGVSISGVPNTVYGGIVQKPLLGPIGIGVWGLSNGTVGASIGLSF